METNHAATTSSSRCAVRRYYFELNARTIVMVLVAGVAALLGYLSPTHDDMNPVTTHASCFPAQLLSQCPLGDHVLHYGAKNANITDGDGLAYAFGRWKTPVRNVKFHTDVVADTKWQTWKANVLRTKWWHYSSFSTEKYFMGMAIVKLGYANDAFVYVVDKTAPIAETFEYSVRLPGSVGLSFASSSIDDKACTSSRSPLSSSAFISFCYDDAANEWKIDANVTTIGATSGESRLFTASLRLEREEALALLFPLANDSMRPAYVHKAAGSPVRGSFSFGNVSVDISEVASSPALGAVDWTRSLALRCTRWNWASTSFLGQVVTTTEAAVASGTSSARTTEEAARIGINLSKGVYDIDGESQENAIWINGKVFTLRGVVFSIPANPVREQWRIRSVEGLTHEAVNLTFTPRGSREDHTKLVVMESDFIQPYGTFSGCIRIVAEDGVMRDVHVDNAFGVVERHFALW